MIDTSTREWRVLSPDRAAVREIAQQLGLSRILAGLIVGRGAQTANEALDFLEPTRHPLCEPESLTDLPKAVARILRARDSGESVRVFGDYDVDGLAGAAILYLAFQRLGIARLSCTMPNRLTDGFGLRSEHVEQAAADGCTLIVTADNGSSAHEAARRARSLGIDLIVTDHHLLDEALPEAYAVINPKRQAPDYAGAHFCGAIVAFKLACALTGAESDLDLVALGTIADIMPLTGENRALVTRGLAQLNSGGRAGLVELIRVAGSTPGGVRASDVAFQIAPRLNAGGRLGMAEDALRLLLTESREEASALAGVLEEANRQRREIENAIYADALSKLKEAYRPSQRTVVLASRDWHQGVIGIVASRLQSHYYRPTVLVAIAEDGVGRGSGRSIDNFDIAAALTVCREHMVAFGGHAAAAGLTIEEARIGAFLEAFENEAAARLPQSDLRRPLRIDMQVAFSEIDSKLVASLDRLEPYGQGNPSPVFCTFGVEILAHSCRVLKEQHLRMAVRHDGRVFTAIGFRMADRCEWVHSARMADIAFCPQFNTFRGETTIQLVLKDIRPAAG